jgi:hypothetical protein
LPPMAERRLFCTLEMMLKIINKRKPYYEVAETLDVCDPNFNLNYFELYFTLDESIIGNGLREIVRFKNFLAEKDESIIFHKFIKLPKPAREQLMSEFCTHRFDEFRKSQQNNTEISATSALVCVAKCMHPKVSCNKLEAKLDDAHFSSGNVPEDYFADDK